ncbi:M48 family metallopeptidase [Luteimonas kalidii]|uniref:M48 family metallopeptidase n=1 Tax=Luteimonas kalidii TaxID=3042025 RepID=A0ABT6JQ03_9GAMM|nr:M48 family metallopeptidase [Luteimonas kalidii]MDH5832758.1 M48 family metallopeptidase [Luteimonas kalidii]
MTEHEQRARVLRLEAEARDTPSRYRLRLLALALLGHGVVVGLLLLALAPFALVAVHLFVRGASLAPQHAYVLVLPAVVAAVVMRALWVRFESPDGYRLAPGEAPLLQAEVERLRQATGAPPLEGIVIDGDFNAKAASVPRVLGLLGHRHTLVLGLPLMRVLDREELAAVIAHEFGHFGARDGRFAAWIYLSRGTWYRLRDGMAQHGFAFAWLLARFYAWLAPRFDLDSRALTRRHEYAADAVAARAAGEAAAASALLRVEIASRRLDARFWPRLWARARSQPHPPVELQAPLLRAMTGGPVAVERLLAAAARAQDPRDTHPALPQRIEALRSPARLLSPVEPSAALLGGLEDTLERRLDAAWRDDIRPHWEALHAAAAHDRARLAELDAMGAPTPEQLAEHALLVEQVRIDLDPLPLYERALAADPDRVLALFRAGLLQLRRGEVAGGSARLRRAVELDRGAAGAALEELRGIDLDPDLAPATAAAVDALRDVFAPLSDAGPHPAGTDPAPLLPHDLDPEALHRIARRLACEPRVARAWVARRRTALREAPAQYLVLLDWRGSVAGEAAGLAPLQQALALPGATLELFTGAGQRRLAWQVRAVCGEPVYRKGH